MWSRTATQTISAPVMRSAKRSTSRCGPVSETPRPSKRQLPVPAEGLLPGLMMRMKMTPAHPVGRRLREGDEVAGFTVLDVPGHSPGYIALWRESDGVLLCSCCSDTGRRYATPIVFSVRSDDIDRGPHWRARILRGG